MSSSTRSRTAAPRVPSGSGSSPAASRGLLAQWSAAGPIAYVEAEYFGGVGGQRAAAWDGGTLALGPLGKATRRGLRTVSPVSQALRRLGARRSLGEDEFSAVGLDRHRHTDDWISARSG
ncbi:hypothetical protein [Streptomyces sp. TLI_55]|uniref:hypothetical protein n=1 Tax=Streptomyces sp. TLI_55 TaxID=1938861 RepID=UPI001C54212E|nr:hypothetical protein [Streptomyces sp. TLI_55]